MSFRRLRAFAPLALLVAPIALRAQRPLPLKYAAKPTVAAITPADLMSRLYGFADDSMMGRPTGSIWHDKGTAYIARELARLGLKPAGDSGTYFQQLPLVQRAPIMAATVTVDGKTYAAFRDFLPRDNGRGARTLDRTPVVYGGILGDTLGMISQTEAAGKAVVFALASGWQVNRIVLSSRYAAAAGIFVATLDSMPEEIQRALTEPGIGMRGDGNDEPAPAFFYVRAPLAEALLGAPPRQLKSGASGRTVSASPMFIESPAPGARNVIAILPGSDPKLSAQYVAIGAHSDHVGFGEPEDHDSVYAFNHVVRPNGADDEGKQASPEDLPKIRALLESLRKAHPARVDSIFNGADDDGSGSMGLLEVAEAFATAKDKPKRSILFVWHVAEEQGMVGSSYFTDNPTVPRDSIVGQINIDMIGRGSAADMPGGGPGYLQLIGSRRLSSELGDIVEAEGKKFSPAFRFDYGYDANGHPQQFYCRSDHYSYARYGIPIVFMSTGGHSDYHQLTDEPQYIDYDQLARVSQLVYNTASRVANLDHRLVVDKPKPDPRGQCRQ